MSESIELTARLLMCRRIVSSCSVGHEGKFGHEFLEFEFRPDGLLRYANSSNYKKDTMIRKEGTTLVQSVRCSPLTLEPLVLLIASPRYGDRDRGAETNHQRE